MMGKDVGIGVSRKQEQLEKEHAGGPYSGRAAKPRQDEFSEDELSPEEQKCAEEDRQGKLDTRERKPGLRWRLHRRQL